MTKLTVTSRNFAEAPKEQCVDLPRSGDRRFVDCCEKGDKQYFSVKLGQDLQLYRHSSSIYTKKVSAA